MHARPQTNQEEVLDQRQKAHFHFAKEQWQAVFNRLIEIRKVLRHPVGAFSYADILPKDEAVMLKLLAKGYQPAAPLIEKMKDLVAGLGQEKEEYQFSCQLYDLGYKVNMEASRMRRHERGLKGNSACALLEKYLIDAGIAIPAGLVYQLNCFYIKSKSIQYNAEENKAFEQHQREFLVVDEQDEPAVTNSTIQTAKKARVQPIIKKTLPVMEPGSKELIDYSHQFPLPRPAPVVSAAMTLASFSQRQENPQEFSSVQRVSGGYAHFGLLAPSKPKQGNGLQYQDMTTEVSAGIKRKHGGA